MRRTMRWLAALMMVALAPTATRAQFGDVPAAAKLVQATAAPVKIAPGGTADVIVTLHVLKSWHVNANPAANAEAIPTEVEVESGHDVKVGKAVYPTPRVVKLSFDPAPMLVWDGTAQVRVPITVEADAKPGARTLEGKVKFQSCNDEICLPPAKVPFDVAVEVTAAGAASGAATQATTPADNGTRAPPESAATGIVPGVTPPPAGAPPSAGFNTAPPPAGSAAPRASGGGPLAEVLERGGFAAFLTLFLIGLALNLTPCVYPMIGVTVSIFGARRAAPPAQVIGSAVLYVLGMATMYSAIGLVAAFTGGLFGGFLQSPIVLVGIGVLLIALSLSMFGLYEITVPPALLERLGGANATSATGIFLSGLVVGVFAAPCTGPPVVALLAVVGAKGDPLFGFTSFFTLAMGLGFPYLLLATFSNLIQSLPRSGDWMVWVKKVFGVILVAVGLNYALLALAPKLAGWVTPVALVVGGIYLGFLEKSAAKKPAFRMLKWVTGAGALVAGVLLVALAPSSSIAFEPFTPAALDRAVRSGAPVMIDFSANWCLPCHELDRTTFTDRAVIAAARGFRAFKVDLTKYDSPDAEALRRQYAIRGVPTVIFLANGTEVGATRVEGFMKGADFAERLKTASAAGAAAER